jgi:hypothetical protein
MVSLWSNLCSKLHEPHQVFIYVLWNTYETCFVFIITLKFLHPCLKLKRQGACPIFIKKFDKFKKLPLISFGVKAHYNSDFKQENVFFSNTFCIILGVFFLWFHLTFWWTHKMDFDTKASNIIFIIFQMKIIFNKMFFSRHKLCLFEWKTCLNVFCEIALVKKTQL